MSVTDQLVQIKIRQLMPVDEVKVCVYEVFYPGVCPAVAGGLYT